MPNSAVMLDAVLIPAGTLITQKGDSPAVEIAEVPSRLFLLTLQVTEAVEQEYIELEVHGSPNGNTWATRPLTTLPQRFYPGSYPTLIDLSADTDTRFVRVHWEVSRWGRGDLTPHFVCGLTLRGVSQALLQEA